MNLLWELLLGDLRSASLLILTLQVGCCSALVLVIVFVFKYHKLLIASASPVIKRQATACVSSAREYLALSVQSTPRLASSGFVVTAVDGCHRVSPLHDNRRGCSSTRVVNASVISVSGTSLLSRYDTS